MITALKHGALLNQEKWFVMGKIMRWFRKKLYKWLMLHASTKVEGEKLQSLHHYFEAQIYEALNSNNNRKTRCLQNPVASVAGQHTQGTTQYTREVYEQCGIQMSALMVLVLR
jgi:hypothetical protein